MNLPVRLVALCTLPLALAGCKDHKKPPETSTAQGEILPGSASDAMLPLDTVRSHPPLAPQATASGHPGGAAQGDSAQAAPSDAASDAGEAPAATPSPSAAPSPAAETGQ